MGTLLDDLAYFVFLQERLSNVTPENLASLAPGGALPLNAEVIGNMSPALKSLLWIYHDLADMGSSLVVYKESTITEEIEMVDPERIESEADIFELLFWLNFYKKYPETKVHGGGYGPNFEVYYVKMNSPPTSIPHIEDSSSNRERG